MSEVNTLLTELYTHLKNDNLTKGNLPLSGNPTIDQGIITYNERLVDPGLFNDIYWTWTNLGINDNSLTNDIFKYTNFYSNVTDNVKFYLRKIDAVCDLIIAILINNNISCLKDSYNVIKTN